MLLAGFPPPEQSHGPYRGALRGRDNGDALTRIKLAAQALEPNDLREGVPASISPLVPCHFSADNRRCLLRLPLRPPLSLLLSLEVLAPPSSLVEDRCTSRNTQASSTWPVYCCFVCIGCMQRSLTWLHTHLNHRPAPFLIECDLAAFSSCNAIRYCPKALPHDTSH
jgi:hypothetical protein